MTITLILSNVLLWLAVIALGAVVFALTRQIGVLYERVAPAGALMTGAGLKTGERAPEITVEDMDGDTRTVGAPRADGRSTLVFFLSPSCPICESLLPVLRHIEKEERGWLDILIASDGEGDHAGFRRAKGLTDLPYLVSTRLGLAYQVSKLPFAALIDDKGVLTAFGLTNSREHLESLFEAKARNVASLQDYMKAEGRSA
ncbi:methylamine dehydrogenase accessory protein MauD [Yunchengibacter salinarum]|uniref:methylamine dehydrogenase accessory protein MauD n=1 Tax=Yunchengibacter salinarum TaxID=3133399 RepID=UPI0035B5A7C5